jgi:hypothetical protein
MNILLEYLNNKDGIENLQTIVIITLIIFLYEFILFYVNLIPQIKKKIQKFINNLKIENLNKQHVLILKDLLSNSIILDILHVFYDREQQLLYKNNIYTILTGIILICGLLYLIYILNIKQTINLKVILMSLIILIFIFIFQYLFYIFGMKYKNIDSISDNELKYFLIKNL